MLKRRLAVVLTLAVAMGLLASYVVYQTVKAARGEQTEMEQVVIAAANVNLGEALTSNHVKVAQWPKATLPSGTLKAVKDAEGRVARTSIVAGELILDAKLAPTGQGGLMPVLVPPGKRAVSIKVDEAVQRSGFVLPNSRVDVLVTMSRDTGRTKESRIVLQDVSVLASDQTVEMKDNKPVTMVTVTMALSPEETERLALAQNEGKVTLALRNMQDTAKISTPGVTVAQLLGSPAPAPAPAGKQEKKPTSPVRSAAKRQPPKPAVAATAPPPPMAKTPEATPPQAAKHVVSVIKGASATDVVFVQDKENGWLEAPSKGDGAKRQ